MPFLYQYLIKFSVSLAVLYTFYYLVLRPLTFYQWNRFYLAGYSLLSFIIPFIDITGWLAKKNISDSYLVNSIPAVSKLTSGSLNISGDKQYMLSAIFSWNVIGILFLIGALVMLTRVVYQYLSLSALKGKAVLLKTGEFEFYDVPHPITPFSFANAIFINSRLHSEEEFHKILEHEFVHVKQKHTIDIVLAELVCVFNWYNPFAWLIRKAIRQNLEFIADKNVLEGGLDPRQYQYLLLKVMNLPQYSITNNFSFSSLKKRITMMNKIKTARVHLVKFLFVWPLLMLLLLAFRDRIKLEKEVVVLTYAGIIFNVGDHQPLKNMVVRELNSQTTIKTDEKGFFKLRIPVSDDKTNLSIEIFKNGDLRKEFKMSWTKIAPKKSAAFIGFIGLDNGSRGLATCEKCFEYHDEVIDKKGLFVDDISREAVQQKFADYLQGSNDVKITGQTNPPILEKNAQTPGIASYSAGIGPDTVPRAAVPPAPPVAAVDQLLIAPIAPVTPVAPVAPVKAPSVKPGKAPVPPAIADTALPVIVIRGISSPATLDPLYVIDGKVLPKGKNLQSLDPRSIKSINVLKGPDASALYGEDGKDGVIMVTTKDSSVEKRVAGVASTVRIKGLTDFKGLIIVDGIESNFEKLSDIPPDSIENVRVLKDKASTGIYNEKGKNGVIIITTKKSQ